MGSYWQSYLFYFINLFINLLIVFCSTGIFLNVTVLCFVQSLFSFAFVIDDYKLNSIFYDVHIDFGDDFLFILAAFVCDESCRETSESRKIEFFYCVYS